MNNTTASSLLHVIGPNISDFFYSISCIRPFHQGIRIRSFTMKPAFIFVTRIIAAINIIAAPPTVVANLLVLIAVLMSKKLRTVPNVILLNVVFSSILQGLISFPLHALVIYLISIRQYSCTLVHIVSYIGGSVALVSILAVMILAFEKYAVICATYSYDSILTLRNIVITSLVIWIFSLLSFLLVFFASITTIVVGIITTIVIFNYIFNVFVHLKLFFATRKILRQQASVSVGNSTIEAHNQIKQARAAKFAGYAIFFLLFCYLPTFFKQGFTALAHDAWIYKFTCDTILCLHSTFSPLLYCWQSPAIGKAVKNLWRCCASSAVQQIGADSLQQTSANKQSEKTFGEVNRTINNTMA